MFVLLTLATLATVAVPPTVPSDVEAVLRKALARADGAEKAVARVEDGPLGVSFAAVAIPDAYPGTGVVRAVLVGGKCYGAHCPLSFADLARAQGWLKEIPAAPDLVRVLNAANYNGLLAIEAGSERADPKNGGLLITFMRTDPFNPSRRTAVLIGVPVGGPLVVTETPMPPKKAAN